MSNVASPPPASARRPDYGIDAPTLVRNLAGIGVACLVVGALFHSGVGMTFVVPGVCLVLTALVMVLASKVFKLRKRDRMLDRLHLRGDERALDLGCGKGLLLIGLAKRLPHGHAVGADIWLTVDQSGNDPKATMRNAEIEGVAERVETVTADLRKLPFEDGSFDVVTSTWAIHNIEDHRGRMQAVREAWRVLKPGGRLVVADIGATQEYVEVLRGLTGEIVREGPTFEFVIPTMTIWATKPALVI